MSVERLLSAATFLAAGSLLFVGLFSRVLLRMTNGPTKSGITYSAFAILTAAVAVAGYRTGWGWWNLIPCLVLASAWGMELHLRILRRHLISTGPVEVENSVRRLLAPITTHALALKRYEVRRPDWTFDRLRIVHVSDLHINTMFPLDWYVLALDHATFMKPDLFFITGDLVSHVRSAPLLPGILCHATARMGTYAILGNHDHWSNAGEVASGVRSAGVTVLGNAWKKLKIAPSEDVIISGCEEPWSPDTWRDPILHRDGCSLLVLSHTPDNIYRLSQAEADVVFAGHNHGGQIVLPLVGSIIVPSRYGRRFDQGHFRIGRTDLFVTTGLGADAPPLRIYCQPEILVVDLIREESLDHC